MATTTYDVNVRYILDDKASKGLAGIGKAAQGSASGTSALSRGLKTLVAGALGFGAFRLGKKYLIDYNKEIEVAKVSTAGLLQLNMGGDWARNQKRANFLVAENQKNAAKSVGTTKDYVDMTSLLAGPLSRAGSSVQDIVDVTHGAVTASKAFGIEAEIAARDIESALAGTLAQKDRFARALLEPMGLTTKAWNELVKKSPMQAAGMLKKAFDQPAIKNMAAEFGKSWAGVTSTLEDNLERALGKVGVPLMQKLTAEFERLNKWFEENPKKVEEIVGKIADGLTKAFEMAKRIFGFIVEHKELLMFLAKAYLAGNAVGMAGGIMGGFMSSLGAFSGGLEKATGAAGLSGFASKLGSVGMALGGVALAATAIADWIDSNQESDIAARVNASGGVAKEQIMALGGAVPGQGIGSNVMAASPQAALKTSTAQGWLKNYDQIDFQKISRMTGLAQNVGQTLDARGIGGTPGEVASALEKIYAEQSSEGMSNTVAFLKGLDKALADDRAKAADISLQGFRNLGMSIWSFMDHRGPVDHWLDRDPDVTAGGIGADAGKGTVNGNKNTNVTIKQIQVVSDDPDRFAFNLASAFEDFNGSPSQAAKAISER